MSVFVSISCDRINEIHSAKAQPKKPVKTESKVLFMESLIERMVVKDNENIEAAHCVSKACGRRIHPRDEADVLRLDILTLRATSIIFLVGIPLVLLRAADRAMRGPSPDARATPPTYPEPRAPNQNA